MNAVIKFFAGLGDVLRGAVELLIGLIADLLYIIQLTAKAVSAIPSYFGMLPSSVVALLTTIFAVVVLYKIFGREG